MDVEFLRYQFEDGYYGVIAKYGFTAGVRHLQMLYMLVGSIMLGMVRGTAGIAVIAMVDQRRLGDTYIQIHTWDKRIQGAILSSFFFGYAVMLFPADQFLRKVGGKIGLTGMLLLNGAMCVAMPTIANKGGWVAICNAYLFMGMSHGCFSTTFQTLLQKWLPPSEKKFFSSIIFGGLQLGIITSFPLNAFLSTTPLGWELIYYASSMLTLAMAIVCFTLTASTPEDHQAIGDKELAYIRECHSYYRKKEIPKPWVDILLSAQFWAFVSAHVASNVLFVFFIVGVPIYFNSFLPVSWSASYSMTPFLMMWFMYLVSSPLFDFLYRNVFSQRITINNYYKSTNAIGACCIVLGLSLLSNVNNSTNMIYILLNIILGLLGLQCYGFLNSLKDMSENYSSTLLTISSTVSALVASAVPIALGMVLSNGRNNEEKWRIIFLTLATMYTICNLIYLTFGSNERQDWDQVGVRKNHKGYVKGATGHINLIQLEEINSIKLIPDLDEIDTQL